MKFITDDVARSYAMKVALMRGKQLEAWAAENRSPDAIPRLISLLGEARVLEREVDQLTLALLDDRANLEDEPDLAADGDGR